MAAKIDLTLHQSLTRKQREVLQSKSDFLLLSGVAGTAKTYTALARGFRKLTAGDVERIIIIRSAVSCREIGHLPGTEEEKAAAYAIPYMQLVHDLCPKTNYRSLESRKLVEFSLTSFLRGTTFTDAYVLVDEYENMSNKELDTIITRVGNGTQLVLCGDSNQTDLKYQEAEGHKDILRIYADMEEVHHIAFGIEDIVRSGFVKSYYEARARLEGFTDSGDNVSWLRNNVAA